MDRVILDCRQLDNWDFTRQLPTMLPVRRVPRRLPPEEASALRKAVDFGKFFSPTFELVGDVISIAGPGRPRATLLPPSKGTLTAPGVSIAFSKSSHVTGALALSSSVSAGIGLVGAAGVYASTTRDLGVFLTAGVGLFFNTPSTSVGGEVTEIFGTPADFSGRYFGLSVSVGVGLFSGAATLLFSPGSGYPLVLTLMGYAVTFSGSTPTHLPVSCSIQVTDTKIKKITTF